MPWKYLGNTWLACLCNQLCLNCSVGDSQGTKGVPGLGGFKGQMGWPGKTGVAGPDGRQGPQGEPGPQVSMP